VLGTADRTPPRVVLVTADPPTVDVRAAGATVTVRARLRDDAAGVAGAEVSLTNGQSFVRLPLRLVAGSRRDGVWHATWPASPCESTAGTWTVEVSAVDRLGRASRPAVAGPQVQVTNDDRVAPRGTTRRADAAGAVIAFDEDVVGLTSTSALLVGGTGAKGFFSVTPVPGSWTCRDASDGPVDCGAGPVRTATIVADVPGPPNLVYGVVLNPEHQLGVLDLAGNPASPRCSPCRLP
jgi:hypothetical protein